MSAINEQEAVRLNKQALQSMAQGQPGEAKALLRRAVDLEPRLLPAWLNLAAAQKAEGDFLGALETVEAALSHDPLSFRVLLMRATLLEAMGKRRQAAQAYNDTLSLVPQESTLDPGTQRAIAHGLEFHARHVAEMESFLKNEAPQGPSGKSAESRRMGQFADHLLGKRKPYRSDPTGFFYPGLPSIEFHDREEFPWLSEVESATQAIQEELAAVLADESASSDIEPYMQRRADEPVQQWAELNQSLRWSAYHFSLYGRLYEDHLSRCPVTASLLSRMPQPRIPNRSPAALFSILKPKTHIPAHNGVANIRLLCHLPLILPPHCRFRVGNSVREWKLGEAFVFDDTIEHEAWNDSDQLRAVLIFDIWHPHLGEVERDYITRTLNALDRFNAEE